MNKVILMGRLTRDPEVRRTQEGEAVAKYSLAVDKYGNGTDYPSCVAFGKSADFAEKYLKKGTKVLVEGRIQTGSYTNKDNQKVYTTDVVVDRHEFAESKGESADSNTNERPQQMPAEGFMNFDPDDVEDDLPFGQPTR